MPGDKEQKYMEEAYYTTKNINYMMRATFKEIKGIVDDNSKSPEERNFTIREKACLFVPDKIQD